ncbi:MurR/RpiR family transcriptional regulator [Comamonas nitrativorans]|uniref:MurR/RpiR family transcriptional regulator n=1 Tax=Comamonas nitrativorans TaxID=108437 RepID=A0ABV9GZK0_9BURK
MPIQPAHPNATPFLARLRQMLDQLSPTEKKLALLVLDTPIHLGSYSASELAQITDVSNATITRFVRHLGYGSYEEARRQARLEADAAGTLPLPPAALASANAPNSQALWQAQQDKLRATLAQIPASTMNAIAAALHRAPRVTALGLGANHLLAQQLCQLLAQALGKPAQAEPAAGQTLDTALAPLARGDILVLCALGGVPAPLLALGQQAQRTGIQLLCITDLTSAAPASDWLLRCDSTPHAPMLAHLIDTSAAHTLVYGLVAHTVQWGATPFELE